jgi:nucleoside-diphosphate-sugar epimerase
MKILVTGGSGFLGSHIIEQLLAHGYSVRALVRKSSDRSFLATQKGVELAFGAVENIDSIDQATKGVDGVIHAAGLVKARSFAEFDEVNVTGTANVLGAAQRQPSLRRFVMVSSLAAVGPSSDGRPVSTIAPPGPVTYYGKSKLAAEQLAIAAASRMPVTVIRPPLIYGPRDRETLAFFKSIKTGVLPYLGNGKNTLSVIYGPDCARACVKALDASVKSGSAYFVEDGKVHVWREMLEEIEGALGQKAFLRFSVPLLALKAAAVGSEVFGKLTNRAVMLTREKINELAAPHWVCDSSDTRRDLSWTPEVKWPEGTRRAVEWYRSNGWL